MLVKETRYLKFRLDGDTGRTMRWSVLSQSSGIVLAEIRWYGPWRQYCVFFRPGTIFNDGCLQDVQDFIKERMAERRG